MNQIRNARSFTKEKGIFCIEGGWDNDHRDKKSVVKALDFLECIENVKTISKQCSNSETLLELVSDSLQARYKGYGILYVACHGEPSKVHVGKKNKVSLEEISERIDGKANGKIIHFGSCSTMNISGWAIRQFLKKTNALAISGYRKDIDFVSSTAFDLLYFQQCQRAYDIRKIEREMKKYYSKLSKELGFTLKHW